MTEQAPVQGSGQVDPDEATTARDDSDELDIFAAPPDDVNPAIIDARKTYVITIMGAVLFCGAIVVFLLL